MKKSKNEKESILRFSHQAMDTCFEIIFADIDKNYARQTSQAVFAEIDRLENLLTRFNPCSDIGQINNLKPGQFCTIGIEAFECIEKAHHIQNKTGGAFSIHYASQWKSSEKLKKEGFPLKLDSSSGRFMAILEKGWHLTENRVLKLDLGGMGKGFALDKAVKILNDWGIHNALVHGGTSTALAVGNPPGQKGWSVGVAGDWNCSNISQKIFIKNRAVSSSGKQVKGEHIIDPRTGLPASGHQAAWVSHPSATTADALSTAFAVMSTSEVEDFCRKDKKAWAVVVLKNGSCKIFNQNII